ncbi:MAG: DUF3649 domain-containing protein [Phycisphaerae bacterium]
MLSRLKARHPANIVPTPPPFWAAASRLFSALVGGYVVANLAAIAVGVVLPITRVEATHLGLLMSFAFLTAAAIWSFAAATATRAWLGLVLVSLPFLAVIGIGHGLEVV